MISRNDLLKQISTSIDKLAEFNENNTIDSIVVVAYSSNTNSIYNITLGEAHALQEIFANIIFPQHSFIMQDQLDHKRIDNKTIIDDYSPEKSS